MRKENVGLEKRRQNTWEENARLENARKGRVIWNTTTFLKYHIHRVFQKSHEVYEPQFVIFLYTTGTVVRALVSSSDPLAVNNQGRTALHLSASKGDVTCLEAIVEAAGPECCMAVDASRHTAIYYAAYQGHYDATVFFIGVNAPFSNHATGKPT